MTTTYTNGQFVGSSLTNLEGDLLMPGNLPASVLTNLEGFRVQIAAPFEFEVRASLFRKQSWK